MFTVRDAGFVGMYLRDPREHADFPALRQEYTSTYVFLRSRDRTLMNSQYENPLRRSPFLFRCRIEKYMIRDILIDIHVSLMIPVI